jgi:hypothetical protein
VNYFTPLYLGIVSVLFALPGFVAGAELVSQALGFDSRWHENPLSKSRAVDKGGGGHRSRLQVLEGQMSVWVVTEIGSPSDCLSVKYYKLSKYYGDFTGGLLPELTHFPWKDTF